MQMYTKQSYKYAYTYFFVIMTQIIPFLKRS